MTIDSRRASGQEGMARAASTALAWLPVGLLVMGAAVPSTRVAVLFLLAGGLAGAMASDRDRPAADGRGVSWAAALPVGIVLAWGAIPSPSALPDLGSCTDPLSPPSWWRVLEAVVVLAATAVLARPFGARPLRLRLPVDRRLVALAALAPLAAVPALLGGPALAGPFFGEVNVELGLPAALLPACVLAVANATLEEVSYRGALLGWGGRALGPTPALVAQGVVFGFAHWGPDLQAGAALIFAGLMAAAIVAGLVARRTDSLLLPWAVHAAVDIPLYYALACRLG